MPVWMHKQKAVFRFMQLFLSKARAVIETLMKYSYCIPFITKATTTGLTFVCAFVCISITSCSTIEKVNRFYTYDVVYRDMASEHKIIRVVEVSNESQPEYYENLKRLVSVSKEQHYMLFYDSIVLDSISREDLLKVKRMYPLLMIDSVHQHKNFLQRNLEKYSNGYALYHSDSVKGIVNNQDVGIRIQASGLVKAYEYEYGKIKTDPIDSVSPKPLSAKRVHRIFAQNLGKTLIHAMAQSEYDSILVIYSFMYKKSFLRSLPDSYKSKRRQTTKNNIHYIQPLKADSLKKKDAEHIMCDGYIDNMGDYVNLKLAIKQNHEAFSLTSGGASYYLAPALSTNIYGSLNYKAISASYSYGIESLINKSSSQTTGKTSSFSGNLSFVYTHWFHNLSVRYIKGFYITNTADFNPQWQKGNVYVQKPQLLYACLEGTSGYKFNPKFSLRAITSQTERQLKSSGSFIASITYRDYGLTDEQSPLLGDSIKSSRNLELGLNMGYYHTFVFKRNVYASIGINPGVGVIKSNVNHEYASGSEEKTYYSGIIRLGGLAAIGYNGNRVFAGMYANLSLAVNTNDHVPIINTDARSLFQLFVGYRLNAPRKMRLIKF